MFQGKKVIIFDMDGTLIDSVGIWNEVDKIILARFGKKGANGLSEHDIQRQRDDLLRYYKEATDPYKEYYITLKERYDFEVSAADAINARYELAQELLRSKVDYKPYVVEFLKTLRNHGFRLVIASTTKKSNMQVYRTTNSNIMSKAPIDEFFELVYTREDVRNMKPDPEIYLKVMEVMGVSAEECLIFEDSLIGVEAGKASGAEVAVIYDKYSDGERAEINSLADYLINDYRQATDMLEKA